METSAATGPSTRPPTTIVQFRPLHIDEALLVMSEVARSSTITGYDLAEWTGKRATVVVQDAATGELLGACLVHHLVGGWSEIAVVYVLERHRGRGVGRNLLTQVVDRLARENRRILVFFCEPPMRHLVRSLGFIVHEDEKSFTGRSPARRFFIHHLYRWQWLNSRYRRREMRRKAAESGCTFAFSVAELDTTSVGNR